MTWKTLNLLINIHEWDASGGTQEAEFEDDTGHSLTGHIIEFLSHLLCAGEPSEHLSE